MRSGEIRGRQYGEMMGRINVNQLAVSAIIAGVLLLAVGLAYGQEHGEQTGHDDHGQVVETHAEAVDVVVGHGEEHGEDHGDHGGTPHLPNLINWISPLLPAEVAAKLEEFIDPIFSLMVVLILALFFIFLARKLSVREPGRAQLAVEILFGGLYDLFQVIIGPSARRYTPYLGTMFIFILANNLAGMFPLGHASTSSAQNTTFALGIMTFIYVQYIALRLNGLGGYLFHLAGSPQSPVEWALTPLFFVLHLVGELIKPVSLSLRLFGNIFGEETLVATMVILGYVLTKALAGVFVDSSWAGMNYLPGLPLQLPFYFLGLLSSTIQALVFTLLSTVYIALWLPHGEHEEAHGH